MKGLMALAAVSLAAGGIATAAAGSMTGYVDLTLNSKYVWRGINFVDDPVLQPSAWVS
ncbi:hypothetical protein GX411_04070 [Candidatus Fermentibacteria bacterium]|nr:hypothetical protein [Candidatus Fermentibacteria bacterium]